MESRSNWKTCKRFTGMRSAMSPMGKFSLERIVWAPNSLSMGTSSSPKVSFSKRNLPPPLPPLLYEPEKTVLKVKCKCLGSLRIYHPCSVECSRCSTSDSRISTLCPLSRIATSSFTLDFLRDANLEFLFGFSVGFFITERERDVFETELGT